MGGDLGGTRAEVHAQANDILHFWFDELSEERWFAKDDALDAEIVRRFGAVHSDLLASGAAEWREDPKTLLAAVIAVDQFSRNIHRGEAAAFAGDALARDLMRVALDRGWDDAMTEHERMFLYMPLMHAEDGDLQEESMQRFGELGLEDSLCAARDHQQVFDTFGRFPSRNAALGRVSTPAEREYLSRPDAGW